MKRIFVFFYVIMLFQFAGCSGDYLYPIEYPEPQLPGEEGSGEVVTSLYKVVAHRGGASEAGMPDNSVSSLKYAIGLDCYASECDIYWTKDNKVVVAHAENGCLINGLKPWEHTLEELRNAGKLSNGEQLPSVEEFIDIVLEAGTTKIWFDVKRISEGGSTVHTEESVKACAETCRIIKSKKAEHLCEFIVSGNKSIWDGCYQAAMASGINAGWMSYSSPSDYGKYIDPWANIEYTSLLDDPKYTVKSYLDAGIALSVYTVDKEEDMDKFIPYYGELKAICTNYPAKLISKISKK